MRSLHSREGGIAHDNRREGFSSSSYMGIHANWDGSPCLAPNILIYINRELLASSLVKHHVGGIAHWWVDEFEQGWTGLKLATTY